MTVRVAIVGGGPVGLATAIGARLAGLSPVIFEARSGPIDKACGEGLMPGAMAALRRLGVDPAGSPIRGIRYQDARRAVEHRYGPGVEGRGVRRLVLHAALLDRAAELGVPRRAVRVDGFSLSPDGVEVAGERFDALVGADGLHSSVRAAAGLDHRIEQRRRADRRRGRPDPRRYGLRQHFSVAPWSDLVEVTYLPDVEVYVTPVDDWTVGVAVLGRRPLVLADAIARVPALAERLEGAAPASEPRAAGALRQRSRVRTAGRVALVGDASGYVDALTGEGLSVGLAQSEQLVAALAAGALPAYERAWSRSTRDFRMLTAGLLAAATSPARGLIVPAAAAMPRVFGAVVNRLAR